MPELIERGHIYIAQPPLYKFKKGKQEQYVKDDAELSENLLQAALDGAALAPKGVVAPLTGKGLEDLARGHMAAMAVIERLSRRYDSAVLEHLIHMPPLDGGQLRDGAGLGEWANALVERLNVGVDGRSIYRAAVEPQTESESYGVTITRRTHGLERNFRLGAEFFGSTEYASLSRFSARLADLFDGGAEVRRGERLRSVRGFREVMDWLFEEAKRGQHIQRYKGLGEMNPEQLWETTMNPATRRLLQVRIEDAIAADEIFTTLMGDQVEPRRDFIEQNALDVLNLDV
jgi:DNA gyrase subunit B